MLGTILILSDSQYKGWQPGRDDLFDIQRGLLFFVDKYGERSSEEAQNSDEGGSDSYHSTSFENTPSLQSVLSVERSTSGSSSVYPSAESSDGIEEVTPTRTRLDTTADGGITRAAPTNPESVPRQNGAVEPLESAGPAVIRPGPVPGKPGDGPPPPDGRFFSDPLNLRTIMTGTGDGYRSPEPPSRRNAFSPPRHHQTLGGSLPVSRLNPPEMAAPSFSVPQPVMTQPPNEPGLGTGQGYGSLPPLSSSLVLPVELMVYNDLMVDIGTAQYLGVEMQGPGPSPFAHPPMPAHDGRGVDGFGSHANGYRWEDPSHRVTNEPPQVVPSFWYAQQDRPYHGVDHAPARQAYAGNEGQWPANGIVDYK